MVLDDTGYNDVGISDANLNRSVLFHQPNFASFPAASSFPTPAYMMDDSTGTIYKNDGTSWKAVNIINVNADSQFAPTTKSDGSTLFSVSDSEFITPSSASASSTDVTPTGASDFTDNFNTNTGWTQVNTLVTVDNASFPDVLKFNGATQNADRRVYKSLGFTLNNTRWIADFEFLPQETDNNGSVAIFGFFSSAVDPVNSANVDLLAFGFGSNSVTTVVYCVSKDGTGAKAYSSSFALTNGTQYYCRLARTSATNLRLYIWTGSLGGTLVTKINFTIPSTIQGLTTLQATTRGDDGSLGSFTAVFDNLVVYDDEPIQFEEAYLIDNKSSPTTLRHRTKSEVAPSVKVDMGSAQEMLGVGIHFHADTTITSFKIETDENDDTNYRRRKTVPYSLITNNAWNIIFFPRPAVQARRLKITGLDASAKVLAINEIAVFVLSESVINRRHRHINYDPNIDCQSLTGA